MKRKLVKQGAATLMVSIPAKWLKRYSLEKGDEIDVYEEGSRLVLNKEGEKPGKETTINLTGQTETGVRTLITNAYRSGFDIVNVKFSSETQVEIMRNTMKNYLLGFDIIKMGKGNCVVSNITEPSPEQFDILMNKIFFNSKELMRITKERLKTGKVEINYKEMTLRIHQYDSFCRRVAAKRQKEVKDIGLFWAFQTLIVHGQRDLYHLNVFLDNNKVKVSKETIALIEDLEEMFEHLMNGFLKKETSHLESVHDSKNKTFKRANSLLASKKGNETVVIHNLMDSMRNYYLASSPLMGLLL